MSVLWISHRGYKAEGIENTREAFDAAVARRFNALETDLRATADGHIVLHHDHDLRRLAGDPREVSSLTRAELEKVRLTGGGRLLFFDEFIDAYPGQTWTFDVKLESARATIRALKDWAERRDAEDWLIAQSRFLFWSAADEEAALQAFPGATCFAREPECWRAGLAVALGLPKFAALSRGRCYAITPRIGPVPLYTRRIVESYHRRGARVLAFLPRTEAEARAALAAGVDEILTDGLILA